MKEYPIKKILLLYLIGFLLAFHNETLLNFGFAFDILLLLAISIFTAVELLSMQSLVYSLKNQHPLKYIVIFLVFILINTPTLIFVIFGSFFIGPPYHDG